MKTKTLLISIGVVVVAYAGAIFASSFSFESQYNKRLDRISNDLQTVGNGAWRIVERRYDRGLFESKASFVLEQVGGGSGDKFKFVIDNHIKTGPWLGINGIGWAKIDTFVRLDDKILASASQLRQSDKNFASLKIVMTYWGSFSIQGNASSFGMKGKEGSQLVFAGFSLDMSGKSFAKSVNVDFNMPEPGFNLSSSDGEKLSIGATTYQVKDALVDKFSFWFSGDQTLNVASVQLLYPQKGLDLQLKKLQASSTTNMDNGMFNRNQTMQVEGTYGGKPIRLDYGEKWTNLHLDSLKELSELSIENPSKRDMQKLMEGGPLLKLIKNYPVISINPFTLMYDNQVLTVNLKLSFKNISKSEEGLNVMMLLMTKMKLGLTATVPASFLTPQTLSAFGSHGQRELDAQIRALKNKGIIIYDGRNYSTDILYDGGSMTVNGVSVR